ncbi:MAG: hypothetical protein OXG70_00840, partial [Cyanobacteria bacterium MAG IRC1_bin_28]|nr:hypothetical protein [Cyanobacteria bacterium MAG IRC1_bin_28]
QSGPRLFYGLEQLLIQRFLNLQSWIVLTTVLSLVTLALGMLGAAIGVFGGFRYLNDRINDVNTRVNTIYLSPSSKETNSTQDDSENAQINEPSS